ncbi:MAG TPA: hypothetical protein PK344_15985 [Syntrophorhabdaceae bacterium]|nr:hypothetical protein [Syntrophorhabdaceae bacterium]
MDKAGQIKEGDYVSVPPVGGRLIYGQVMYLMGQFADVALLNSLGGRTGKRKQYYIADLIKIGMKTEEEIRRAIAQEKA